MDCSNATDRLEFAMSSKKKIDFFFRLLYLFTPGNEILGAGISELFFYLASVLFPYTNKLLLFLHDFLKTSNKPK